MKAFYATLLIVSAIISLRYLISCRDKKPGMLARTGYHIMENKVFYNPGFSSGQPFELTGADVKTFKALDVEGFPEGAYGKDQQQVYYNGKILPGAEPKSFRRLKRYYSKDERSVFYMSSKLSADPAHFTFVDEYVTKDRSHVYFSDRVISINSASFKILGTSQGVHYYSDSLVVLANDTRITQADPETFKVLAFGYSKDHRHVFLMDETNLVELPDADPDDFQVMTDFYTKDKKHVYWRGQLLPHAEPATFRILNEEVHCSADSKKAYIRNLAITNADPRNFPGGKKCKYCTEAEVVFEK